jgi:excinuclease ABC subunit A
MERWLSRVMIEHTCPDCAGARVRRTRLLFNVNNKTIHELGDLHFDELRPFLTKSDRRERALMQVGRF